MGLTYVDIELYDPRNGTQGSTRSFLVDSGAVYSVVPGGVLTPMGVTPSRTERFTLANGEQIDREIGEVGFASRDGTQRRR